MILTLLLLTSALPLQSAENELKIHNAAAVFGHAREYKEYIDTYHRGSIKKGVGSGGGGRGGGGSSSGGTKGGSSSGGKGGSSNGKGSSTKGKGYGEKLPDYSANTSPPPPYSKLDPYAGTRSYGQTGTTRSYWNGQYYPYRRYGYGFPFMPIYPFFFVGPFGFYGLYGSNHTNSTVENIYNNATNGNSTFVSLDYENGTYILHTFTGGEYTNGVLIGNNTYVNGTLEGGVELQSVVINPNMTSEGVELPAANRGKKLGISGAVVGAAVMLLI